MKWRAGLRRYYLLIVLAATGCASSPRFEPSALPGASLGEIAAVPFFPQADYQCGPAALATVLGWAGEPIAPTDLTDNLFIKDRRGSLQIEMMAATRRQGLLPYAHAGGFEDLWQLLAQGVPVLVLQNLGFSWYPQWHYAVVVGYDAQRQELLLRSGTERLRRESIKFFNHTWQHSDRWMMSVSPPGQVPPGATESNFLSAAHALEVTGQVAAALESYQVATHQWPQSMLAWMALGNSHYQHADYQAAASAYRTAIQVAPEHPAPPHNLAWALIKMGQQQRAEAYAKQALELSKPLDVAEQSKYQSAAQSLQLVQ